MIVTKELAKIYLIKRPAWLIETTPDGKLMIGYHSINWLEGMEVFESQEECYEQLEKRRDALISSGYCPRCNYKHTEETKKDLSYLPVVGKPKDSIIYQCPECKSVWYKKTSWTTATGYDNTLLEFVQEWGNRQLAPNESQKQILKGIGNISVEKTFELYPAHVVLKNGTELPTAMIHLQTEPPPPDWFEKKKWHYFDMVKEIRPSEYAYPFEIAKKIMRTMSRGKYQVMYVKDKATKKIYSFECHAGIFFPEELKGKDLELLETNRDVQEHFNYFEPHERGGDPWWGLKPPPKTIVIRGDYFFEK